MRRSVPAVLLALIIASYAPSIWGADNVPTPTGVGAAPHPTPSVDEGPISYPSIHLHNDVAEAEISTWKGLLISFSLLDIHPIRLREWQKERLKDEGILPLKPSQPLAVLSTFNPAKDGGYHNWCSDINLPDRSTNPPAWTVDEPSRTDRHVRLEFKDAANGLDYAITYDLPTGTTALATSLTILNSGGKNSSLDEPKGPTVFPLNGVHQDNPVSDAAYLTVAFHSGGRTGTITSLGMPKLIPPSIDTPAPAPLQIATANLDFVCLKSRFFAALWEPVSATITGGDNSIAAVPTKPRVGESGGPEAPVEAATAPKLVGAPLAFRVSAQSFALPPSQASVHQAYLKVEYPAVTLKPSQTLDISWKIVITSMKHSDLARLSEVERTVEYTDGFYRFFKVLANILTYSLESVYFVVRNYGVALVVLTFLIKLVLHRMTFKQHESMMKMQRLQPQIKLLQEQHKNDKQKLAQKHMELMRKHGANPLGGCLPVLIQMPIFIALYQAFSHSADMRGESFLWINDLTLPDQIYGFLLFGYYLTLNPLPLIYIGVSIWMSLSQKMPSGGDPQQEQTAKMMRWMPIVMGFFFYNMPAGLVLYFTINALLSTIEIKMVKKKLGMP